MYFFLPETSRSPFFSSELISTVAAACQSDEVCVCKAFVCVSPACAHFLLLFVPNHSQNVTVHLHCCHGNVRLILHRNAELEWSG